MDRPFTHRHPDFKKKTSRKNQNNNLILIINLCLTATEQCDWPENSLCQFDPDAVKAKVLTEKNYLYLTFDDGPNEGTDFVIDALADYDVRATFFINR